MDNDDRQSGRILSRREVLALVGAAGAYVAYRACIGNPWSGTAGPDGDRYDTTELSPTGHRSWSHTDCDAHRNADDHTGNRAIVCRAAGENRGAVFRGREA